MLKNIIILFVLLTIFYGCSSQKIQKPKQTEETKGNFKGNNARKAMEHFIQGTLADQKGDYQLAITEYKDALSFDRKSGIFYSLAKDYFLLNNLPDALVNINKAVQLDSSNTDYYDLQANIYSSAHQNDSAANAYARIIKLDSSEVGAYYNLAMLYEKSKPLEALNVYDKLMEIIGPEWNILARKAELYENLGKFDNAIKSIEELLALDPSNTSIQKLLIESYIKADKTDLAIKRVNESLIEYPDDASFLEMKAQILIQQDKWYDAASVYKILLQKPGIPIDGKIKIGSAFMTQSLKDSGLVKVAKDMFTQLDKDTTFWQIKLMLGEIALLEKNDSSAIGYFNKVIELAKWNPDAWVRLGGLYFDNKRYSDAENLLKEAVVDFPDNFAVNLILGLSLSQLNKFNDAGIYLKKAIDLNPKDLTALSAYGYTLNQMKQPDQAIYYLNEALKISPNNVELLGTLGLIYNSQKKWRECDSTYEKALAIDSTNALVLNNYAYALSERSVRLNKALDMAEKAVAKDSLNSSYLDTMGWIFYQLKNYDKAEDYINKALEFDRNNATIIEHLGDVMFRKGKKDEAKNLWKQSLDLNSDNPELKTKFEKGEL